MAEHSTADREVPGSNPGAPSLFLRFILTFSSFCFDFFFEFYLHFLFSFTAHFHKSN